MKKKGNKLRLFCFKFVIIIAHVKRVQACDLPNNTAKIYSTEEVFL